MATCMARHSNNNRRIRRRMEINGVTVTHYAEAQMTLIDSSVKKIPLIVWRAIEMRALPECNKIDFSGGHNSVSFMRPFVLRSPVRISNRAIVLS